MVGLPFALKAGSDFLLPTPIALVVPLALPPLLQWLQPRPLPSPIAALISAT